LIRRGKNDKILFIQANKLLESYGWWFCLVIKGWFDELFDGYLVEKKYLGGLDF
jgi:hypothetical protein